VEVVEGVVGGLGTGLSLAGFCGTGGCCKSVGERCLVSLGGLGEVMGLGGL
jgi:hypothetical protein